jgi:hypothetical protein
MGTSARRWFSPLLTKVSSPLSENVWCVLILCTNEGRTKSVKNTSLTLESIQKQNVKCENVTQFCKERIFSLQTILLGTSRTVRESWANNPTLLLILPQQITLMWAFYFLNMFTPVPALMLPQETKTASHLLQVSIY